jgi:Protein of unknown function (DUF1488)
MTISFPNQSRIFEPNRHCVRFWGYDSAFEVSFLVEEDALCHIDRNAPRDEAGLLDAFDANRDRILGAARKAYSRRGGRFYALAASDF